jgi:hypothetical protein
MKGITDKIMERLDAVEKRLDAITPTVEPPICGCGGEARWLISNDVRIVKVCDGCLSGCMENDIPNTVSLV